MRHRSKWVISGALLFIVCAAVARGETKTGAAVIHESAHSLSRPLRDMVGFASRPATAVDVPRSPTHSAAVLPAWTVNLNFDGMVPNASFADPDANGAVGATQYVQWVDGALAVYDKTTGNLVLGPLSNSYLWQNMTGNACATAGDGDVIAQYDKLAGRWVMTHHAHDTSTYVQCVAVSTSTDATGTYNLYSIPITANFPDYPKLGIWPDGYYLTFNELDSTFRPIDAEVCALDRASMLIGSAATAQCFQTSGTLYQTLLPSDLDGTTPPTAGTPNYLITLNSSAVALDYWTFHVDWVNAANSTFTGPGVIKVPSFTSSCIKFNGICVPQLGTTQKLDTISSFLMYRFAYRNMGTHESLLVNHTVGATSGVRWYELWTGPANTLVLHQQGTYRPDTTYRWMGSMAMDKQGNIGLGYSASSSTIHPAIRITGRAAADPKGTMQAETSVIEGLGSQLPKNGRWGDYSAMSIDPVDDCTFWYTNEYLAADGIRNASTRIVSYKFNTCQ